MEDPTIKGLWEEIARSAMKEPEVVAAIDDAVAALVVAMREQAT